MARLASYIHYSFKSRENHWISGEIILLIHLRLAMTQLMSNPFRIESTIVILRIFVYILKVDEIHHGGVGRRELSPKFYPECNKSMGNAICRRVVNSMVKMMCPTCLSTRAPSASRPKTASRSFLVNSATCLTSTKSRKKSPSTANCGTLLNITTFLKKWSVPTDPSSSCRSREQKIPWTSCFSANQSAPRALIGRHAAEVSWEKRLLPSSLLRNTSGRSWSHSRALARLHATLRPTCTPSTPANGLATTSSARCWLNYAQRSRGEKLLATAHDEQEKKVKVRHTR